MQSTEGATAENWLTAAGETRAGKYLVFNLGREEFGVRVLRVREIMGVQEITSVPQAPNHVKGVINLRGRIIPVVDLRVKFGLPEVEYSKHTCIIVVEVHRDSASMMMGTVVDGVVEVLNLADSDIEDTPDFGHGVPTPSILGMAKMKGQVKILLDIDRVLTSHELHGLDSILS